MPTKTKSSPAPRAKKSTPVAPDMLRLEYVALETVTAWEKNPKKHDIGAIWESIQKHGLKDPPKFEPKLNGGKGGIVEGNGRSHVLREMRAAGENPPRGVVEAPGGSDWLIPVLFGVDAKSERAAEAYGVDHNNLVLSGGDFSGFDISKLWDANAYAELLADLANGQELPVSVDGEDVDDLIARLAGDESVPGSAAGGGNYDSFEQEQKIVKPGKNDKPDFGVLVLCDGEGEQQETFQELRDEGYEVVLFGTKPPGVKR